MSAAIIQKTNHYRSELMSKAVRDFPCGNCGIEDGTVVGAHPNGQWFGKGRGIKAHDLVASLCYACHQHYDSGGCNREDAEVFWLKAMYNTMLSGFKRGVFQVTKGHT